MKIIYGIETLSDTGEREIEEFSNLSDALATLCAEYSFIKSAIDAGFVYEPYALAHLGRITWKINDNEWC